MSGKLFTNLSPTARWIILPFSCVLAPVIINVITGISFILTLGLNGENEYPILFFIKDFVQSFLIGFAFVRGALHIAPSHNKIVMQIVRIIGVCLIALLSLQYHAYNLLDWKNIIFIILMLIGVLIRLDDEKEIIEEFD